MPSTDPMPSDASTQLTPDGQPLTRRALRELQAKARAEQAASHSALEDAADEEAAADQESAQVRVASAQAAPIEAVERPEYMGTKPRRARSNFVKLPGKPLSIAAVVMAGMVAAGVVLPLALSGQTATDRAAATQQTSQGAYPESDLQAFVVPSDVETADVERSVDYQAETTAQLAAETGINTANAVFTNDPTADVQWPFKYGTGMSYGYGVRDGVMHEGIDFTPGDGAPNQAIADGVVIEATEHDSGYGVGAYIEHEIDGQKIISHYAHMQYGSLKVKAGDHVKVGDPIGLTGDTGHSFGAHLHFELIVDGHTIDPMPWLREHAGS